MVETWTEVLGEEKQQAYFQETMAYVKAQRAQGKVIYPPAEDVFNAFRFTEFNNVKVVMLGQDPYHGPNQAHGLCFSVLPNVKVPPSLKNMYKELATDIPGFQIPDHGYLADWARQGVLMLNSVLTVEQGQANSHKQLGWERFTDKVIDAVNQQQQGVVFMLWGSHAQRKGQFIDTQKHYVLKAPHPSPLSAHRGFFGCKHFSQANQYLAHVGKQPINWHLPAAQHLSL